MMRARGNSPDSTSVGIGASHICRSNTIDCTKQRVPMEISTASSEKRNLLSCMKKTFVRILLCLAQAGYRYSSPNAAVLFH